MITLLCAAAGTTLCSFQAINLLCAVWFLSTSSVNMRFNPIDLNVIGLCSLDLAQMISCAIDLSIDLILKLIFLAKKRIFRYFNGYLQTVKK